MTLIELKNVSKRYGENAEATIALSDVTVSIAAGEFLAIMGPSGSGKSTLLHILGLLDSPTSGEYWFEGKRVDEYISDDLAHIRNRKMGFVFQAFNLLPRTSVLENVKLPLLYSVMPPSEWEGQARTAAEAVGLGHRLDHEPAELSGGEKQRVAIARALVTKPQVIFADEPTGNLDTASGQAIMAILQQLNERDGHTIVLITHETSAAEHAQRILQLRDGQIERDEVVRRRRQPQDFTK